MPRLLRDRARLMSSYIRGKTYRVPGPSSLFVETTVRCNLRCPMCPRTGSNSPSVDMPDSILFPLLEDFARLGGDHVYLYGLGEPLLDTRIFQILRKCQSHGLGTILSTNGTLLDAPAREELLDSGCDHVIVGIDGVTPETYAYYREGGVYSEVVENVRALAASKIARSSRFTLVVQLVRMARNMGEIEKFLELWKNVPGVDLVRIKDEDIGLPDHAIYEADGHLRENPCHILWRGPLVVKYTGDVFACYHMASHDKPVGNLQSQTLEEIWDSPEMQELRSLHTRNRAGENSHCASCPAPRPKLPFILGAMALRGVTVRKLLPVAERLALQKPGFLREKRPPIG